NPLFARGDVVQDNAGKDIEIGPELSVQNDVLGNEFDIPAKAFDTFPLKKDKIFAVIGVGFAINQTPIVAPGGGIIWLFTDKFRLEGVFPKPALVYNPWDNW